MRLLTARGGPVVGLRGALVCLSADSSVCIDLYDLQVAPQRKLLTLLDLLLNAYVPLVVGTVSGVDDSCTGVLGWASG